MVVSVLDECHKTFVSCFHAFYPTGQLKWACLCDLLLSRDVVNKVSYLSSNSKFLIRRYILILVIKECCRIASVREFFKFYNPISEHGRKSRQ